MQAIQYTHFTPYVNRTFTARHGETSVHLDLLQVSMLRKQSNHHFREQPFILVFRSPLKVILPQSLYTMFTSGFEEMDIFITAVGADQDGIIYHAVFN